METIATDDPGVCHLCVHGWMYWGAVSGQMQSKNSPAREQDIFDVDIR